MPLLPLIEFLVIAVIWVAVLLEVISNGVSPNTQKFWMEVFVLLGFPLIAYRSYLRIRAARGELD